MQLKIWAACLLGLVAFSHTAAGAKQPTVAVMPFRDLAGGSGHVGEAIRETVTTDLRQIGSLRVVERGNLDKILAEQGLQVQRQDMDVSTVVKLGKVLGASLIVVGAYQKMTPQVRLTARFIKVETSEVIGTAKVDGSTREFLRLQDRITAALLRSAGFAVHAKQVLDDSERRPDLASLNTLEYYGQAVTAVNDQSRRQYLAMAVAEDQNFSYAVKDLEELEKRLDKYQAAARATQEKELQGVREKLRVTTDRAAIDELSGRMALLLFQLRRYNELIREARAYQEGLPAGAPASPWSDQIGNLLVQTQVLLRDWEAVLRDGERFLKRAPGSASFNAIKMQVELAISRKRQLEAGREKADADVANLGNEQRWDLCTVAQRYRLNEQYAEARRLYDACFQLGTHPRAENLEKLVEIAFMAGDHKELRRLLPEWSQAAPKQAAKWKRDNEIAIPVDE